MTVQYALLCNLQPMRWYATIVCVRLSPSLFPSLSFFVPLFHLPKGFSVDIFTVSAFFPPPTYSSIAQSKLTQPYCINATLFLSALPYTFSHTLPYPSPSLLIRLFLSSLSVSSSHSTPSASLILCLFLSSFPLVSVPSADGSAAPHVLVDYEEVPSLSLSQRVALWLAADVFLLTTVREGLNLYPLEYICSRRHLGNVTRNEVMWHTHSTTHQYYQHSQMSMSIFTYTL